jgi:hypothetical protein
LEVDVVQLDKASSEMTAKALPRVDRTGLDIAQAAPDDGQLRAAVSGLNSWAPLWVHMLVIGGFPPIFDPLNPKRFNQLWQSE